MGNASLDGNYLIYLIYPIHPICPIRPIFPIFPILPVVFVVPVVPVVPVVLFSLPHLALIFSTEAVSNPNCYLIMRRGALAAEIVAMWGCRAA